MTLGFHNFLLFWAYWRGYDRAIYFLITTGARPQILENYIMNSDANIPVMLKDIETVLQATRSIVESMQPKERKQLKELAQLVGTMVSKDAKDVLSLVSLFAHNTDIAHVTRGKNGGVVRGPRAAKVVKAGKKAKAAEVVPTTDTTVTEWYRSLAMTRERKLLEQLVKSWAQYHDSGHTIADYDTTDEALQKTAGYFTWVVREGFCNIDLMSLVDQLEVFLENRRSRKHLDGMYCVCCGNFYEYAEPNQQDGSMKCYTCRSNPYI